jgi:hypothetical protein
MGSPSYSKRLVRSLGTFLYCLFRHARRLVRAHRPRRAMAARVRPGRSCWCKLAAMSVLRFSLAALAAPRIEMPAALRERTRVPIDRMLALS